MPESLISQFKDVRWSKWHGVTFILILFFATGLRLYKLNEKSLWYDELHSIIPTAPTNTFSYVIEYAKADQPPLFFIMLHSWFQVFPYNEASGKVFSALIGVLGVVAMYFLGEEIDGRKLGFASMFITGFNMFHIYYSQELRFYSLLFLLTVLSFFAFIKLIKKQSANNQILFILASVAILYTHYFGIVVLLSQVIIFIIIFFYRKEGFSFLLKGIFCTVVIFIAFIPWLPVVLRDNITSTFWIIDPGPLFIVEYFKRYFQGWWPLSFKYVLTIVLALLLFYYLFNVFKNRNFEKNRFINFIIIGWSILTLLIPYLYTVIKLPMLVDRYTIITLPALILMIAIGWMMVKNRYLQIFLTLVFLVCCIRVFNRYYNKFKKTEYRELAQEIIAENVDLVPVLSKEAWHFSYFFRKYEAGYEVLDLTNVEFSEWIKHQNAFMLFFQNISRLRQKT